MHRILRATVDLFPALPVVPKLRTVLAAVFDRMLPLYQRLYDSPSLAGVQHPTALDALENFAAYLRHLLALPRPARPG